MLCYFFYLGVLSTFSGAESMGRALAKLQAAYSTLVSTIAVAIVWVRVHLAEGLVAGLDF